MSGPSDIAPIILAHKPGDKVTITYFDATGQTQNEASRWQAGHRSERLRTRRPSGRRGAREHAASVCVIGPGSAVVGSARTVGITG